VPAGATQFNPDPLCGVLPGQLSGKAKAHTNSVPFPRFLGWTASASCQRTRRRLKVRRRPTRCGLDRSRAAPSGRSSGGAAPYTVTACADAGHRGDRLITAGWSCRGACRVGPRVGRRPGEPQLIGAGLRGFVGAGKFETCAPPFGDSLPGRRLATQPCSLCGLHFMMSAVPQRDRAWATIVHRQAKSVHHLSRLASSYRAPAPSCQAPGNGLQEVHLGYFASRVVRFTPRARAAPAPGISGGAVARISEQAA